MFEFRLQHRPTRSVRIARGVSAGALCILVSCASSSAEGEISSTVVDTQTATTDGASVVPPSDPAATDVVEATSDGDEQATSDGDVEATSEPTTRSTIQEQALNAYLDNDELHEELVVDERCATEVMTTLTDADAQLFVDLSPISDDTVIPEAFSEQGVAALVNLGSCYEPGSVVEQVVNVAQNSSVDYDEDCLRTKFRAIPDLYERVRGDVVAVIEEVAECEITIQDRAADNLVRSSTDGETVMLDIECGRRLAADISDEDAQKLADRDFTDEESNGPLGLAPETVAILQEIEKCESKNALIDAVIDVVRTTLPGANIECMRGLLEPIDDLQDRLANDSAGLIELLGPCTE